MYGHDRRAIRAVFCRAWQRYRDRQPLEGVETMIVAVVAQHPEYHALLEDPAAAEDRDFPPETGTTNPFMHLGMHLAIEEQLSIDQPSGVRARFQALLEREADAHRAQHRMMDCLAEMLWQASREAAAPDPAGYLDCLGRLSERPAPRHG
ncbi:MAG TPA: DUF1841 family protein [Acidiferrobacterales bacterium]